jgi:hypothetical protein
MSRCPLPTWGQYIFEAHELGKLFGQGFHSLIQSHVPKSTPFQQRKAGALKFHIRRDASRPSLHFNAATSHDEMRAVCLRVKQSPVSLGEMRRLPPAPASTLSIANSLRLSNRDSSRLSRRLGSRSQSNSAGTSSSLKKSAGWHKSWLPTTTRSSRAIRHGHLT